MYVSYHQLLDGNTYTAKDLYAMDRFALVEEAYLADLGEEGKQVIYAELMDDYNYRLVGYRTWFDEEDNSYELHLVVCHEDLDPQEVEAWSNNTLFI